ncbi:putative ribonuclease H-like domain-containing protein [Tanacetum coccineum]
MPPKYDLVLADEVEYLFSELVTSIPNTATREAKTCVSKPKSVGEPLIEDWIFESEDENEIEFKSKQRKPSFAKTEFVKSNEHVKTPKESVKKVENKRQAKYPRKTVKSLEGPTRDIAERTSSNVFNRAHTHVRRTFNKSTTNKNGNLKEKVNTVKRDITTVGPKAVVSDNKGNEANAVKATTCWVWRPKQKVLDHGNPQLELQEKGVIDSGCSRHMTGNMSYLLDYKEIDSGFVAFGGDPKGGRITGKGKISTGKLDFEDVYFVKELKFNLFSVLQMSDKKNSVLFTNTECVVLSPDFKLLDENHDYSTIAKHMAVVVVNKDYGNAVSKGFSCDVDSTIRMRREKLIPKLSENEDSEPNLEEIVYSDDDDDEVGAEADMNNLATNVTVSPIPSTRVHTDHPLEQIIDRSIQVFILAYASFMRFIVNQMDVKSAFFRLVEKALYGLHQSPKASYKTLSTYLLENGFRRGTIDKTLFIKKEKGDILLVQVYVDDIIFGSTKKSLCVEFEQMMHKRFQMSSMGELTFFLGLQVKQKDDGIFISQDKYVANILKKFDFATVKTTSTLIETNKALLRLMKLQSLTHLHAVKRIFRYLKGQPKLGLWYPRDSPFDLEAFSDSDYAGASLDRKFTTGGCQFLGKRLISWQCKKQTIDANSTTKAEYVAAANCCRQEWDAEWKRALTLMILAYSQKQDTRLNSLLPVLVYVARHTLTAVRNKLMLPDITYYCWVNMLYQLISTLYTHVFESFLGSAKAKIFNGERQIQALVDKKKVIITKTSIRSDVKLDDAEGINCLPTVTIFCRTGNNGHLEGGVKFLMYPRFVQVFLDKQVEGMIRHKEVYVTPSHTKKVFANMKRSGKCFSRRVIPLFLTMMIQALKDMGKDSAAPSDSHSTPIISQPSSSKPQKKKSKKKQRKESGPTEPVTNEAHKVLDLDKAKTAQAKEIASLKKRVKQLEKRRKLRTLRLKRLRKVGLTSRVESSNDVSLEVTLVDEIQEINDDNMMFDTDVLEEQEKEVVEKEVSIADLVTTASEVVTIGNVEANTANAPTTTIDELNLAQI